MNWFFLALGSILLFSSSNLLQRILSVKSKNARAMSALFNATAAVMALLISLFSGSLRDFVLPDESKAWIALAVASLVYGIAERVRFSASKLLEASIMTTVANISVVVAFIISLFLYSEPLTISKLIGSVLIFIALFLVSSKHKNKEVSKKGLLLAILMNFMYGLGWSLDKMGATYFSPNIYNIFIWFIPIIFIYLPYLSFKDIKIEFKLAGWKIFVLSTLNVIGYLMQLKALAMVEATKVIPIFQLSTIVTIISAIFLLKEKKNILLKIIAGLIAITGVYFLI